MTTTECTIEGCHSPVKARGMCNAHYKRNARTGNPLGVMPSFNERFWSKIDKSGECWEWTGTRHPRGYGYINGEANGRKTPVLVHRVSYEMHHGPIAEGVVIDHICHNTSCVNPDHLRAVSQKQNVENQGSTRTDNKSGYRGVCWDKRRNSWRGTVVHNQKQVFVGYFGTASEAGAAVTARRVELFTHNDMDRA